MNNLLSYCGLVDAKIRASDIDLPVFVSGHLDRASNDEFSVECLFLFFQQTQQKSGLKVVQITKNYIF